MKKEVKSTVSGDNNFGLASVILAITGIFSNFNGIFFGIIALIFGIVQYKRNRNNWGLWGIILAILAIIIGIIAIVMITSQFLNNPDLANQLAALQ